MIIYNTDATQDDDISVTGFHKQNFCDEMPLPDLTLSFTVSLNEDTDFNKRISFEFRGNRPCKVRTPLYSF